MLDARFGFVVGGRLSSETGEDRGAIVGEPYSASVDGRFVATWAPGGVRRELHIIDVAAGTSRLLLQLPDTEMGAGALWSNDGRAVAAVIHSRDGIDVVFFSPKYAAIRTIDLASGAVREVYRANAGLQGVGWDRAGGVLALLVRTSSFGIDYHVVRDGRSPLVNSFQDVCTAISDRAAVRALIVSPQCFNKSRHVRSDELRLLPLGEPAATRVISLSAEDLLLAAAFRPMSRDVIVLVGNADRRSMRLELWPNGDEQARRTIWSSPTPPFDEVTAPQTLKARPDGSAVLVDIGDGPGNFRLIVLATGSSTQIELNRFPYWPLWVTLDAATADRLRP